MNQIRAIQALNKREIENGISPEASWHTDYRDTAFVNFGGLPYELSEGDIITIFSQYGEPVFLKLARDKESGKSKGFGWLKYEDQRSCDLAVDNLGGAEIAGRLVRVDHARYKARDDEDPAEFAVGWADMQRKAKGDGATLGDGEAEDAESEEEEARRPLIREEIELQKLIADHDDDDPMKAFLVDEKKREVQEALQKEKRPREKKGRHHHRHHTKSSRHRSHRDGSDDDEKRKERDDRRSKRPKRDDSISRGEGRGSRRRDETPPFTEDRGSRRRDDTPERRTDDRSRDRDRERERRRHDKDGDDHRDRHSRKDPKRIRDGDAEGRHSRRGDRDQGRHRDKERDRRDRRRSRSRSPPSYRDKD